MSDDKFILTTRNVVKRFGGLTAVNKMTVDIERGRIFSIIGPNGAGKTTFFNAISGALPVPRRAASSSRASASTQPEALPDHPAAHGPHLPEHPAVRRHDRGGEHHGRRLHPAQAEPVPGRVHRPGPSGRRRPGPGPGAGAAGLRRPARSRQRAGPQPALRRPAPAGDRPGPGLRAQAAAPGRAGRGHEPGRKRGRSAAVPAHPRRARHHHPADRAPHEGGHEHVRAHLRDGPRRADRRGQPREIAAEPAGDRGLPGQGRRRRPGQSA